MEVTHSTVGSTASDIDGGRYVPTRRAASRGRSCVCDPPLDYPHDLCSAAVCDNHDDDCDCAACLIATGRAIDATHYYIESTTGRLIG